MKRAIETYSPIYLAQKESILAYQSANKKALAQYKRVYMREYTAKRKDAHKRTLFWNQIKNRIHDHGYLSPKLEKRFKDETGISFVRFCRYMGDEKIDRWLFSEGKYEISHKVSKSTLEKLGVVTSANYYKNIDVAPRSENASFHSQNALQNPEAISGLISDILFFNLSKGAIA